MKYLSLPSLAQYYDLHQDTLRRKFKQSNLIQGEHFVVIGGAVRYDVEKVHSLLTHEEHIEADMSRFLV